MRKFILCLPFIFMLLSIQNQAKTLYFKIKVKDQQGKAISNCSVSCMPNIKQKIVGVTDQNGIFIFSMQFFPTRPTLVQVDAMHGSYGGYYISITDLDKAKEGDTLTGSFTMSLTKKK